MNDYRGSAMNDYRMVVIFSAMLLKNEPLWNMNDYRDSAIYEWLYNAWLLFLAQCF
jgi:hypothetical protein